MKASLLLTMMDVIQQRSRRIYTFNDNVRFIWFLNTHHFNFFSSYFNGLRERCFTYFAFKLIKIVTFHKILSLLFDFVVNPLFQTIYMNNSTIPFTFARRYQNVIINLLMTETNFASRNIPFTFGLMIKFILAMRDLKDSLIAANVF